MDNGFTNNRTTVVMVTYLRCPDIPSGTTSVGFVKTCLYGTGPQQS